MIKTPEFEQVIQSLHKAFKWFKFNLFYTKVLAKFFTYEGTLNITFRCIINEFMFAESETP